ncbi:MAG: hypothetical protein IKF51_01550, partial [Solobacterium sp.]|nr:hypothetical protein [Solobacterium sp.]
MMIHIREEDRVVFLTGRKTYAEAMGRQLIFFRHQGKWLLRVPYDIRAESPVMIEHGQSVILRENHGQNVVHLDVSRYSEGYGSFHKYVPEGSVEIGNRIDCDVYVQDRNAASCTIYFKERTAEITDAEGNTTVLNIGDRFRTVNLCLVYHPLFLMINAPANIYVSLPAYSREIRTAPLPAQQCPVYDSGFRSVNLSDEFTVVLEEPEKVQEYRRNPLLFTMGPALTMSSAALCAGLISVYRGWLNGRSVMDLLPMVMLPGVMVISTLIWTPAQRIYDAITNQRRRTSRDNSYRKYLEHRTEEIECFKKMYDQRIRECFPEPLQIRTKQILRMPFHDDFLCVRYGEGEYRLHINFDMRFHLDREDPLYLPLNTLLHSDTMSTVGFLSLKECRNITVQEETVFWWILSQLCLLHAPDALKTVFLAPSSWFNEHRWICRIPHVYCGRAGSGIRLFAADEADLHMIVDELNEHGCEQVLFVIGNELTVRTGFPGCIIHCGCTMIPPDSEHILYTDRMLNSDGSFSFYEADGITEEEACSMLSVLSLQQSDSERFRYLSSGPSFFELYGLTHASEFAIEHRWDNNMVRDSISALIGIRDDGREMILNLHEHGNGPHGLIAGMTGSGKSELLITLILSLAVSYSPRELQFVMIDFKGGGAVSALTPNGLVLPHICGILTDLDDLIVDRALVSFQNECRRRESLFVQMSDMTEEAITDIHSYQQKWQSDCGIPYLPELIIIVDEFAELKKNYPGFMKDLITLARVGRSLGIHLILATQKPAGIVDEQIWSNSRFKLCLRVQDKQDSSEVLHDPCASRLRQPGSFYFLCDGLLERGYAGYSGSSAEQGICSVSLLNLQ